MNCQSAGCHVYSRARLPGRPPWVMADSGAAPSSPEGSCSNSAWAQPQRARDSDLEKFKMQMMGEVKTINEKCGGPAQYLQALSQDEAGDFAKYLWDAFPEKDDLLYHHSAVVPVVKESELASFPATVLHVAALGFGKDCTLKPAPGKELFGQVVEQYLQDGFLTSGEPLLVVQSRDPKSFEGFPTLWSDPDVLPTFSLAYLKGFARATSALALLHKTWKLRVDLKIVHPVLYQSFLAVHVHHLQQGSKMDEALQNMKLSARSSIRKKQNVVQTVVVVQNLYTHGLSDFTVFIRKWNSMSARSDQIIGKRAMALKLLFESAPKVPPHTV